MKKINGIVFLCLIFTVFIFSIFSPDLERSYSEKRNLQQFKTPTVETLLNGKWFKSFSDYSTDQFPLREQMRSINANFRLNILSQLDVGGIYTENGYIFKSDYPNKDNSLYFAEKTNDVYETYIKNTASNYYVSVVPDKTYFDNNNHLKSDAKEISETFYTALNGATYIDIFDSLSLDSYYKTDTHWSQDKLFPVMEIFAEKMNFPKPLKENYTENVLDDFYGVYHGQSALNFEPDKLVYMTNEITDSSEIFNVETNKYVEVYNLDNFDSSDSYNIFSDGASSLVEITSPNARTEKELIIFRDSFGSSIAPLFLEEYSKVTLVDLRYMSSKLLEKFVNFENSDVLVLYSSLILNSNVNFK